MYMYICVLHYMYIQFVHVSILYCMLLLSCNGSKTVHCSQPTAVLYVIMYIHVCIAHLHLTVTIAITFHFEEKHIMVPFVEN